MRCKQIIFLYTKISDYPPIIIKHFVAKGEVFVDPHHEKTPKPLANQVKERKVMMLIPSNRPNACRS